ncbi:hypothetical protein PHYBOEH_010437 [Phytophthora boehmeriae]|uniref:C2H2-type domain-containing protein n=1 Tax=Phytophthora boehmeriae TaxID=109152 RepID=A0A8T1WYY3_9STRA|nr:hypothetical protein PHYBOEH_010437 [Phytophthora boehmeriae]
MKSPVKAKQEQDVDMQDKSETLSPQRKQREQSAISTLARFKAQQDLKIETHQLMGDNEETKVPAPPSSTGKKRRRRPANQIDRKFSCHFPGCEKAYGSEGSLTQHQRLKHAQPDANNQQLSTFLLPAPFDAARAVSIRPAASNQLSNDRRTDVGPPSAKAQRQHSRLRSNSMPVAFSASVASSKPTSASKSKSTAATSRARARKPRRAATPHPKKPSSTSARRCKIRSKSESLPEMTPLLPLQELKAPASDRSFSDQVVPTSASFEWPPSAVAATGQLPTTSVSSDDQAIDSDILSVLANCDASDLTDSTVLDFGSSGPPSFQSSTSFGDNEDAEMFPVGLDCFKIAENTPTTSVMAVGGESAGFIAHNEIEPTVGLSAFATLDDDWANLHLSHHLQRMSFASPHHLDSTFDRLTADEDATHTAARFLRSASDPSFSASHLSLSSGTETLPPLSGIGHFPSLPVESVSVKPVTTQLWERGPTSSETVKTDNDNIQQLIWLSNESALPPMMETGSQQLSSEALDEMLSSVSPQLEDDEPEWNEAKFSSPAAFQGDVFGGDGGLGEVGLASALLCQREEL